MAWTRYTGNKYGSKKVRIDGIVFDSKKEARRYQELLSLERAGAIQNLRRQVKYVLIPAQHEKSTQVYTKGPQKGLSKQGRLIERECSYIADFVYTRDGETVVEDTKGFRTKEYVIKRKLLLYTYGLRINEL